MDFSLKQALGVVVVIAIAAIVIIGAIAITNTNTDNAKTQSNQLWQQAGNEIGGN